MTFAERLREALWMRRMNQKQLAEAAGVSSAHVSHLLKGKRDLAKSAEMVMRMARALNVSLEWLVMGVGSGPTLGDKAPDTSPATPRTEAIAIARGHVSDAAIARIQKESASRSVYGWIVRLQAVDTMLDTERGDPKASEIRAKAASEKRPSTAPPPTKKSNS